MIRLQKFIIPRNSLLGERFPLAFYIVFQQVYPTLEQPTVSSFAFLTEVIIRKRIFGEMNAAVESSRLIKV